MSTVSIVMPCFNARNHLPTSIGSLLEQTYADWELIAVDDGSIDGTYEWLKSIADPRIRVIRQRNGGVSFARNTGMAQAYGEFIAFLDADDTWAPQCLSRLTVALCENSGANLVYCGWQNLGLVGKPGEPFIPPDYEGNKKIGHLLEGCRWPIHACLVRREAVLAVGGFDESLKVGEDYLLWLEIALRGTIVREPEVLAFYRHHEGVQATKDRVRAAMDTLRAKDIFLTRHPEVIEALGKEEIERLTWGHFITTANQLYWQGDLDSARPLYRKALLAGRGSTRDRLRMLPSLLPRGVHSLLTNAARRM